MIKKNVVFVFILILLLSVQVAADAPAVPLFKVSLLDNKEITINIWMTKGEAVLYLMGNHMFRMTAKYLPISGSSPDNLIELKGSGFRKIYLNRSRKILYFREGSEQMMGEFAKVSLSQKDDKLVVKFVQNAGIAMNISMDKGTAAMYFKGNHMFRMTAKYLPISGSSPDNLIELKGDGFRKIHLNRSREILYFREGTEGTFARVSIN